MTDDAYLRTPEGGIYNLVGGLLLHEPSPGRRHQRVALRLAAALHRHAEATGAGEVYVAPLDVHLGPGEVYEPDVFFVGRQRLGRMTERGLVGCAPDLAAEVLSPYTATYDRGAKLRGYGRHGCREYWLLDPVSERVEVFLPGRGSLVRTQTLGTGETLVAATLPGLAIAVGSLFRS